MTSKQLETVQKKVDHNDRHEPANDYRSPRIFDLGDSVNLVRRNCCGHLRDGTGGWWVYNS